MRPEDEAWLLGQLPGAPAAHLFLPRCAASEAAVEAALVCGFVWGTPGHRKQVTYVMPCGGVELFLSRKTMPIYGEACVILWSVK